MIKPEITAKWANTEATIILNKNLSDELEDVLKQIHDNVKKPTYSMNYYSSLHDKNVEELINRGFSLEKKTGNQFDGEYYIIKW